MKLDDGVAFRLARVARALYRPYVHRLRRYHMTPPQMFLLLALYERDDVPAGELASRVCLDKSTLTGMLARLERDGLLLRAGDEDDGRSVRVCLTEKGRRLRRPLTRIYEEVNCCMLDALGPQRDGLPAVLAALESTASSHGGPGHRAVGARLGVGSGGQ